jgi:hypothetical protein
MRSKKTILLAAALAFIAVPACAQTFAPGLWQHTMSLKGGQMEQAMAEMQQQLAALPTEQRRQMEQMMAQRGIGIGAQGTTVKVCLTKEDAARMAEPQFREGCKQQVVQRSGNKLKVKFECGQPEPASGEGEFTFSGDKAYTGVSTMTAQVDGKPQQMQMQTSGQWISADCGAVKAK